MEVSIDPMFSVWRLVGRVGDQSTQLHHRPTMNIISYEIENITLLDGEQNRIFAGFQSMSKFLPQVERYTRIAQRAKSVHIFGVPDVPVPEIPGIVYVPLSRGDRLSKEWFLVSTGEGYASALVTEEVSGTGTLDSSRVFNGLWTFDVSLVAIMNQWLINTVDIKTLEVFSEAIHNTERQSELIYNTLQRLKQRIAKGKHSAQIQAELETITRQVEQVVRFSSY
jgi:DICT domain-containing protein